MDRNGQERFGQRSGHGLVAEQDLAKIQARFRLPLAAQSRILTVDKSVDMCIKDMALISALLRAI